MEFESLEESPGSQAVGLRLLETSNALLNPKDDMTLVLFDPGIRW